MLRLKLVEQLYRRRAGWRVDPSTGQGLVEYALIIMLVALVVLLALYWIGPTVGNVFSNIVVGL